MPIKRLRLHLILNFFAVYQIHKLRVLGIPLSLTILVKCQQPQGGVTRVFSLFLAAGKLLMLPLKGSGVVGLEELGGALSS